MCNQTRTHSVWVSCILSNVQLEPTVCGSVVYYLMCNQTRTHSLWLSCILSNVQLEPTVCGSVVYYLMCNRTKTHWEILRWTTHQSQTFCNFKVFNVTIASCFMDYIYLCSLFFHKYNPGDSTSRVNAVLPNVFSRTLSIPGTASNCYLRLNPICWPHVLSCCWLHLLIILT